MTVAAIEIKSRKTRSNTTARLGRWEPKKWKPLYTQIITLSCSGMPAKMIIQQIQLTTGKVYTPQQISNVLNTSKAREIIALIELNMKERAKENLTTNLEYIAVKTTERMRSAIDNDDLFQRAPFQTISMGIKALEGLGHLKKPDEKNSNYIQRAVFLTIESQQQLVDGMAKANEAMRLHSGGLDRESDIAIVK